MENDKLTNDALKSPSAISLLLGAPIAVASTLFLFTLGSPSALSIACLFVPDVTTPPNGGPKYAASSLGFLRAWGREREPLVIVTGTAVEAIHLEEHFPDRSLKKHLVWCHH
jgi:hypothetical protein